MLSRRDGLKVATFSLAALLARPDVQAEETPEVIERMAQLLAETTYAELMATAYLAIDIMSVWIRCDQPRTLTTGAVLQSGLMDVEALLGYATNPVELALLQALIAAA